ncbi:MAG: hypothetical protein SGJ20_12775 [Planctomycetota bacterium]|nr:hypothetical protein [Planctomycetota bacterium]
MKLSLNVGLRKPSMSTKTPSGSPAIPNKEKAGAIQGHAVADAKYCVPDSLNVSYDVGDQSHCIGFVERVGDHHSEYDRFVGVYAFHYVGVT